MVDKERLKSLVERIERLNEEKGSISEDTRGVYSEAKSAGFDTKALRRLIRERARDQNDLESEETLVELYRSALENFETTPLGAAMADAEKSGKTGAKPSATVKKAAKKFVDDVKKSGNIVTLSAGGKTVVIDKNGVRDATGDKGAHAAP